jgi:hypothetical protein
MRQTLLFDRIFERLDHVILAENIIENLRAIFACKDLITHSSNLAGRKNVERKKKIWFYRILNFNHSRVTIDRCDWCVGCFGFCFL